MRQEKPMVRAILIAIVVLAGGAAAQPALDKPAAMKLFDEGRAELEAGRADAACKKFEQSIRKDPRAVGTLLNLALCNERQGKVASALALFIEAYDRANEANQLEQRRAAEEHIATLRPQVPVVAISYAGPHLAGEKLVIDDRVVAQDEREVPLDPGPHTVVLTAPGRLPFETTLVVRVSTRVPLTLPVLAAPSRTSTRRLVAKISIVGGAGLVVAATAMALIARHNYRAQFEGGAPHCGAAPPIDGVPVCDDTGDAAVASARRLSDAATIVGVVGVAAAAVGVTLWLTGPSETRVIPNASANGGGVAIVGRF